MESNLNCAVILPCGHRKCVRANLLGCFRNPDPAFSAAVGMQFTVAGAGGDGARQTYRPPTAWAQMRGVKRIPTDHAADNDFQDASCRDGGHS
jgi:hypothetical protein